MRDIDSRRSAKAGLLVALALTAGIAAISEAAPATVRRPSFKQIDAQTPDFTAYAYLGENPDGTAAVGTFSVMGDGTTYDGYDPANAGFTLEADLKPGQDSKGTRSGTGRAVLQGTRTDGVSGVQTPVTLTVEVDIVDAGDIGAFAQQGVSVQRDPVTNEPHVIRQHYKGSQAYGMDCGGLRILADDVVVVDSAAGWGSIYQFDVHEVDRLR